MKCDEVQDQLLTAGAAAAEVQKHLAICDDCRAAAELLGVLRADGEGEQRMDLSPATQTAVRQAAATALRPAPIKFLWAAAAVLAIAVVIAWSAVGESDRAPAGKPPGGPAAVADDAVSPLVLEKKIDVLREDLQKRIAAAEPSPPPPLPPAPPAMRVPVRRLRRRISSRTAAMLEELQGLEDDDTSTESNGQDENGGRKSA